MNTTTSRCFRLALTASLVALATPAMAQITLFEGERFEGRNLSSQRRLPDLERSGLRYGASSVVVQSERWEVCEDARFRDGCKVLRRGRYPSLASMGLNARVASARPLATNVAVVACARYGSPDLAQRMPPWASLPKGRSSAPPAQT